MKISVVGLGYVELPLSLQFARSGLGLDTGLAKVAALNAGESHIKRIESAAVQEQLKAKRFLSGARSGRSLRSDRSFFPQSGL
jgi:UDP-N-acetyl-D-glucosamine dehydrogenase